MRLPSYLYLCCRLIILIALALRKVVSKLQMNNGKPARHQGNASYWTTNHVLTIRPRSAPMELISRSTLYQVCALWLKTSKTGLEPPNFRRPQEDQTIDTCVETTTTDEEVWLALAYGRMYRCHCIVCQIVGVSLKSHSRNTGAYFHRDTPQMRAYIHEYFHGIDFRKDCEVTS